MSGFTVTRQIGIDAGHRIMTHGSKCRHLHGHRYTIEAAARSVRLHDAGEQTDMIVDFGFLKEEMMAAIDAPCDHGFIAALEDRELLAMFRPEDSPLESWIEALAGEIAARGWAQPGTTRLGTKLYVIPFQPTAECLAKHWFERLEEPVRRRSDGLARLVRLTVWETPNCRADYEA